MYNHDLFSPSTNICSIHLPLKHWTTETLSLHPYCARLGKQATLGYTMEFLELLREYIQSLTLNTNTVILSCRITVFYCKFATFLVLKIVTYVLFKWKKIQNDEFLKLNNNKIKLIKIFKSTTNLPSEKPPSSIHYEKNNKTSLYISITSTVFKISTNNGLL